MEPEVAYTLAWAGPQWELGWAKEEGPQIQRLGRGHPFHWAGPEQESRQQSWASRMIRQREDQYSGHFAAYLERAKSPVGWRTHYPRLHESPGWKSNGVLARNVSLGASRTDYVGPRL